MDAQVLHLSKLWRAAVRLASPFAPQLRNAACDQVPIAPPLAAIGAIATPVVAEGQRLVAAALAAAQPEEPLRQDAALLQGIEVVLDEPRNRGTRAGLGVGDEASRALLH